MKARRLEIPASRIVELLAEGLKQKRWTVRSVGAAIDVPFTTVSDWLRGRGVPPLDRAQKLAKFLGFELRLVKEFLNAS